MFYTTVYNAVLVTWKPLGLMIAEARNWQSPNAVKSILTYIYIYIYMLWHKAACHHHPQVVLIARIPLTFSPSAPISCSSWYVLYTPSGVHIELMYESFYWSNSTYNIATYPLSISLLSYNREDVPFMTLVTWFLELLQWTQPFLL